MAWESVRLVEIYYLGVGGTVPQNQGPEGYFRFWLSNPFRLGQVRLGQYILSQGRAQHSSVQTLYLSVICIWIVIDDQNINPNTTVVEPRLPWGIDKNFPHILDRIDSFVSQRPSGVLLSTAAILNLWRCFFDQVCLRLNRSQYCLSFVETGSGHNGLF